MFFNYKNRHTRECEYQTAVREVIKAAKVWKRRTQTTVQDGWWPVHNLRRAIEKLEELENDG